MLRFGRATNVTSQLWLCEQDQNMFACEQELFKCQPMAAHRPFTSTFEVG